METRDTRRLSPQAQEDLRRRVMRAVRGGMSQGEAARTFGVVRQSIYNWSRRIEGSDLRALRSKPRGRPRVSRLLPHQAATTVRMIEGNHPEQLRLPFALWTRDAVRVLLEQRFGVAVSVWTVGRYLAQWGLTPQKPLQRAYERNPRAVKRWLETDYPAIEVEARRRGAEIHWGDELGLRSDHQAGRSYGRRGKTPVIPGTGQRFRCNVISALTNRGKLAFMVFRKNFTADVFLEFLRRLIRHARRMVFLILDQLRVHRSKKVRKWLGRHTSEIRTFFLPAYSPDLNPDELLNQDVKTNALGRTRPRDLDTLVGTVRSYLRSTQGRPQKVRRYFDEEHVRYAAA